MEQGNTQPARPGRPTWDQRLERRVAGLERVLIYAVALLLLALAVLGLVNTVVLVWAPLLAHDYTKAITYGIDSAFLTVILLELLHTIITRGAISRQLQEFLVIGITSAVRHGLAIAAGSSGTHSETREICNTIGRLLGHAQRSCRTVVIDVPGGTSRDVVVDLAINAVGVLLLVVALRLVRRQTGEHDADGAVTHA